MHDPDTMVDPLTPKSTLKAEVLVRVLSTIALCHEEDAEMRKWSWSRYCDASCILETKTKVGSTSMCVVYYKSRNRELKREYVVTPHFYFNLL